MDWGRVAGKGEEEKKKKKEVFFVIRLPDAGACECGTPAVLAGVRASTLSKADDARTRPCGRVSRRVVPCVRARTGCVVAGDEIYLLALDTA